MFLKINTIHFEHPVLRPFTLFSTFTESVIDSFTLKRALNSFCKQSVRLLKAFIERAVIESF